MSMSIQDRINALNIGQVRPGPAQGAAPPKPAPAANKPSLPPRLPPRSASTQDVRSGLDLSLSKDHGNQPVGPAAPPPLPARKQAAPTPAAQPARKLPPALPARNPSTSQALVRRDSTESIASTVSARSSISQPSTRTSIAGSSTRSTSIDGNAMVKAVRAPAYDPTSLPPLPPKKEPPQRPGMKSRMSSSSTVRSMPPPSPVSHVRRESLPHTTPPPMPARREPAPSTEEMPPPKPRRPMPAPAPSAGKKSPLSYGMNPGLERAPSVPQRPTSMIAETPGPGAPPPIPTSSRPDLAALQASKPKAPFGSGPTTAPPVDGICMRCRDFSGPDNHAARFPRQSIPSTDVHWLAHQLTSPFQSDTDKARALFTWCHHNVAYDTVAFFSGNLKPSTPASTISSGMAVCEGYAGLYNALALAAGLQCVVTSGHGMGLAKEPLKPSDPTPPEDATGHAWNVVRIDNGEWKLIDACWGAGSVDITTQGYTKQFSPKWFIMPNTQFGLSHFPSNHAHQFRGDNRTVSWDEYIRGGEEGSYPKAEAFLGVYEKHGLDDRSFMPRAREIVVSGAHPAQRVRFAFTKHCPHFDMVRAGIGRPYVMFFDVGGVNGRPKRKIPVPTDGSTWSVEIAAQELGAPGTRLMLYAWTTVNGMDARGRSIAEFQDTTGRKMMSWEAVAAWDLV